MQSARERRRNVEKVADIIRDAGGKVVGRTRLQKIAYLLELAGLGDGFDFGYRHYGPYSEELATATWKANLLGLLHEEERQTSWGGSYSTYTVEGASDSGASPARVRIVQEAANADPVALELAATAAFLAADGEKNPWDETRKRKPEKAAAKLGEARELYQRLQQVRVPKPLPKIS